MSQRVLFAPEVATSAPPPFARHSNYARLQKLMACPEIEGDLLETFRARPNDRLAWSAYWSVLEKHGIGFGLGHKPGSMQRRGLLEEEVIYFGREIGTDRPGSPDYQGFRIEYRLAPTTLERTA